MDPTEEKKLLLNGIAYLRNQLANTRIAMSRPTRGLFITLYNLRIEGRGQYHLEKKQTR